jgi:hypothetical protein
VLDIETNFSISFDGNMLEITAFPDVDALIDYIHEKISVQD